MIAAYKRRSDDMGAIEQFGIDLYFQCCGTVAQTAHAAADSRSRANASTIGFETKNIAISHRALRRLLVILLERLSEPNFGGEEGIRAAIRMACTEALDMVSQEAIETLLMTAFGRLDELLCDSRARILARRHQDAQLSTEKVRRSVAQNAPRAEIAA